PVAVLGEAVAGHDALRILALDHHVRLADGEGLVVQLLAEDLELGLRVQLEEAILRDREHAAGPARGVEEAADDAGLAEEVLVLREEEVDHQPHHVAGGEVLTGRLVARLRELPDELLEDRAHRVVVDDVRVEVDLDELLEDKEQDAAPLEALDRVLEAEALEEDVLDVLVEALDVVHEVLVE